MIRSSDSQFFKRPLVTVIICTHGRPRELRRCLAGLVPQVLMRSWPVVVVDSGSISSAAPEIEECAKTFDAQFVRLDEPGLSRARNAGAALAGSEWLAYMDDDAVPHDNWAEKLEEELLGAPAKLAIVGGKICPRTLPESPLPGNLPSSWMLLLSCVTVDGRGDVGDGWNICGANYVIRRVALEAVGGFPEYLGRSGQKLIGGEESYVNSLVRRSGSDIIYSSSFAVDHWIEPERLKVKWLKQRALWEGVTIIALHKALSEKIPSHLSPLKLALSIPILLALAYIPTSSATWLIRLYKARGSLMAQTGGI